MSKVIKLSGFAAVINLSLNTFGCSLQVHPPSIPEKVQVSPQAVISDPAADDYFQQAITLENQNDPKVQSQLIVKRLK